MFQIYKVGFRLQNVHWQRYFNSFLFFMTNTRKMKITSVLQYFLQRWGNCYRTSNFEQETFLSAPVHRFLWDNFFFVEYCGFHSLRPISSFRFCSTPIFLQIHEVHYSPSVPWRAMVLPFWSGKKGSPAQSHKVGWKIRKFVAWFQRISFPRPADRDGTIFMLAEQYKLDPTITWAVSLIILIR